MIWIWTRELIVITGLAVASTIDWLYQYVPMRWLLLFLGGAGIYRFFYGDLLQWSTLLCLLPGFLAFGVTQLTKGALGEADDWLLLGLGIAIGPEQTLAISVLAFLGAAAVAGVIRLHRQETVSLPFVPFLFAAYALVRGAEVYGL